MPYWFPIPMDPKNQFQFTKQGSKHSSRNQSSKLHKGTCLSKPNILQHMRAIITTYLHISYMCMHIFFFRATCFTTTFFSNHLKTVKQQMFERSNVKKLRTHWKQHNTPHSRVCPANGLKQNYYAKYIREWHPIAYVDENMDKHHGKIGIP